MGPLNGNDIQSSPVFGQHRYLVFLFSLLAKCNGHISCSGEKQTMRKIWEKNAKKSQILLTLSHPEALPWQVKSSGVRQSKITKGAVLANLGGKLERIKLKYTQKSMPTSIACNLESALKTYH